MQTGGAECEAAVTSGGSSSQKCVFRVERVDPSIFTVLIKGNSSLWVENLQTMNRHRWGAEKPVLHSGIQASQSCRSMKILAGNRFDINLPKEHNCFPPSPPHAMFIFLSFLFWKLLQKLRCQSVIFLPPGVGGHPEKNLQSMNINNPKSKTEMTPDFNPNIWSMIAIVFSRFPCWT